MVKRTATKLVGYVRVSTAAQGRSGLGKEAQEAAIRAYAASVGLPVVKVYTEVESGAVNARPALEAALADCRLRHATLVVGKFDRLSRNAAFLLQLRDGGVPIVAADMPEAGFLQIGLMAVIAQHEREQISRRTKEALAAAKRRGKKLGNPQGAAPLLRAGKGNKAALSAIAEQVAERLESYAPFIEELRGKGIDGPSGVARALNEQDIPAPRGGKWYPSSATLLLERFAAQRRLVRPLA
jgi:DNA invertase Pin-like site-specific DNA recombinase